MMLQYLFQPKRLFAIFVLFPETLGNFQSYHEEILHFTFIKFLLSKTCVNDKNDETTTVVDLKKTNMIQACKALMPPSPTCENRFDLDLLTWLSIGIIYLLRIIYLPSSKILRKSYVLYKVSETNQKYWPTGM